MSTIRISTSINGLMPTGQMVTSIVLIEVVGPAYADSIMNEMRESCKRKAKKEGTEYRRPVGSWRLGKSLQQGGRKNLSPGYACFQLHLMFKPYPFAMDILVYTPEEVEAESQFELSFISRVLREGKRLYGQTES